MSLERPLLRLINGVIGDAGLMTTICAFATAHQRDRVGLISPN